VNILLHKAPFQIKKKRGHGKEKLGKSGDGGIWR
jgi:hypothetical protein